MLYVIEEMCLILCKLTSRGVWEWSVRESEPSRHPSRHSAWLCSRRCAVGQPCSNARSAHSRVRGFTGVGPRTLWQCDLFAARFASRSASTQSFVSGALLRPDMGWKVKEVAVSSLRRGDRLQSPAAVASASESSIAPRTVHAHAHA